LSGRLAPATVDIKTVDRCDTIFGGPQGFERFGEADTEGADHPGGYDGHPPICHVSSVKSHGMWGFLLAQLLLHSQSKHFTNDPETETETENESLEVGRLSVEFIQRRFNP
jgi:hypothetical protein